MPRTRAEQATSARGAGAVAIVLRREEHGPVIAVEFVSGRDLVDARAELWFEAFLRSGHFGVPLESVRCEPEPVRGETEDGREVLLGFSLAAPASGVGTASGRESGAPVRCVFPRTCLEPVAQRAARRLVEAGVLASGDSYTYELRMEPGAQELGPAAAGSGSPRASVAPGVQVAGSARTGFPVVETPIAPLLEGAEPVHGDLSAPDDYPVFVTRDARERAERVARKGGAAQPPVETGGLLVGPLCRCPETGKLFAVIADVLEATDSEATTYSLTYSGETWARIQAVMRAKERHPATRGQRILGQVHGHSFLPLGGAEPCAECATRTTCTRTTAFLSSEDEAWCRAVFRGEPWQLSWVFGLDARNEGVEAFFGQRGGRLVARGYSVIQRFEH